jgi:hypothetical protein
VANAISEISIRDRLLALLRKPDKEISEALAAGQAEAERLENLGARQRLADQLARHRVDVEREGPRLRELAAAALEKERAIYAEYEAARDARIEAEFKITAFSFRSDQLIGELEAELRKSAPPEIAEFENQLAGLEESTRRSPLERDEIQDPDRFDRVLLRPVIRLLNNVGALRNRLDVLRELQRQCRDELPLLALSSDELAARIKHMRDSIPDASEMVEVGNA